MIWLVPNNLFWLVSVNHFWLVNGLGPVRSDSGVFVCDRFFAFGNSRLFPERGSLMSDSEMNGARFYMANKDVILSFELRLFWSSLLHCIRQIFVVPAFAFVECRVCGAVIILCDRSEMTSSERSRCGLHVNVVIDFNDIYRDTWALTYLASGPKRGSSGGRGCYVVT